MAADEYIMTVVIDEESFRKAKMRINKLITFPDCFFAFTIFCTGICIGIILMHYL